GGAGGLGGAERLPEFQEGWSPEVGTGRKSAGGGAARPTAGRRRSELEGGVVDVLGIAPEGGEQPTAGRRQVEGGAEGLRPGGLTPEGETPALILLEGVEAGELF